MTDRQIEYIVAIAMEGNMTRAAKKLYVSQSALSQALAHVENELGAKIFTRTGNMISLTYPGQLFLNYAKQMITLRRNLAAEYREIANGIAGQIRIGMSQSRSWLFYPLIFPEYIRKYPEVKIVLKEAHVEEVNQMLHKYEIDMAFSVNAVLNSGCTYHPIFDEQMVLTLPAEHPLCSELHFSGKETDITAAKEIPFILMSENNDLRNTCERIFSCAGFTPHIIFETRSMDVLLQMAASGLGATILPDSVYYFHALRNKVRVFPLNSAYNRTVSLCHSKDIYLPFFMQEFIRIASENLKNARINANI